MTRRWSAPFVAGGLLLVATSLPARGDVVHLRTGEAIEGRVVERGDAVDVELAFGTIRLDRDEVVSIERGPTPGERLDEALAETDMDDPVALEAAAVEAERLGFPDRAVELRARAFDLELERRLADIPADDADGFVALTAWARARGAGFETQRDLLTRALRADPSSTAAREAIATLEEERRAARARSRAPAAPADRSTQLPSGYYYDVRVRVWWWYHPHHGWWSHDGHDWRHHAGHAWGHDSVLHHWAPHHVDAHHDRIEHGRGAFPHGPRHGVTPGGHHGEDHHDGRWQHDGGQHPGGGQQHHGGGQQHDGGHHGSGHRGGGH